MPSRNVHACFEDRRAWQEDDGRPTGNRQSGIADLTLPCLAGVSWSRSRHRLAVRNETRIRRHDRPSWRAQDADK